MTSRLKLRSFSLPKSSISERNESLKNIILDRRAVEHEASGPIFLQDFEDLEQLFSELSGRSARHLHISEIDLVPMTIASNDAPALFLDFADLIFRDERSLKMFILEYGPLFPAEFSDEWGNIDEPLGAWVFFQAEMRALISVWRNFENLGANAEQREFIGLAKDDAGPQFGYLPNENAYSDIPNADLFRPKLISNTKQEEPIKFLASKFNQRVADLQRLFPKNYDLLKRPSGKKRSLMNRPVTSMTYFPSFMGFAIEQFVNAIETGQTFTRCMECGKWMPASNKGKVYDTPSCKAAAGRRRREMLLVSEIRENFSEVFNNVLEVYFQERFSISDDLPNTLIKLFEKENVGERERALISDAVFKVEELLQNGARPELIATHLGLGEEVIDQLNELDREVYLRLLDELRTPYYDWSWGVAFEDDLAKGLGSLLLQDD